MLGEGDKRYRKRALRMHKIQTNRQINRRERKKCRENSIKNSGREEVYLSFPCRPVHGRAFTGTRCEEWKLRKTEFQFAYLTKQTNKGFISPHELNYVPEGRHTQYCVPKKQFTWCVLRELFGCPVLHKIHAIRLNLGARKEDRKKKTTRNKVFANEAPPPCTNHKIRPATLLVLYASSGRGGCRKYAQKEISLSIRMILLNLGRRARQLQQQKQQHQRERR